MRRYRQALDEPWTARRVGQCTRRCHDSRRVLDFPVWEGRGMGMESGCSTTGLGCRTAQRARRASDLARASGRRLFDERGGCRTARPPAEPKSLGRIVCPTKCFSSWHKVGGRWNSVGVWVKHSSGQWWQKVTVRRWRPDLPSGPQCGRCLLYHPRSLLDNECRIPASSHGMPTP